MDKNLIMTQNDLMLPKCVELPCWQVYKVWLNFFISCFASFDVGSIFDAAWNSRTADVFSPNCLYMVPSSKCA